MDGSKSMIRRHKKGRSFSWIQSVGGQGLLLLLWGFMCFGLRSPALFRVQAWEALVLCIRTVIPAVFPIAAAGGILTCMAPPPAFICRLPGRILSLSDESVGVLLISLVSGFPVGAMLASRLLEVGRIDREEASRLCCYTNNASAAFLVGTVGEGFFRSAKMGWILWLSSTLAALCVAITMGRRARARWMQNRLTRGDERRPENLFPTPGALARSVASTGLGMVRLSSFVVFFAVFCAFLEECLEFLLPDRILFRYMKAAWYAFFEITGGLRAVSSLPMPTALQMTFAGACTGFGGLSVFFQCMAAGNAPDALLLFGARVKIGILCGIFTMIFALLWV